MRQCARCREAFDPRAEGQIACSFVCARLMVPRSDAKVRREPTPDVPPDTKPRIAAALAETRRNVWNLMRGRAS